MDAIVLAGGYATRLWPITQDRPKMFLPVGETTIVDRILGQLEADDRIEDVYVSTNARFAPDFEAHLADADYAKPTVSVEGTTAEDEKLGVVGALAELVEREGLDDDALVIAGDNLISFDVADFLDHFAEADAPTLAAYDVGSREKATAYGVIDVDGDRVVDFQEKPERPASSLVSIACYGFPAEALADLDTYLADGNNPDEPGWFLQWLQARQPVHAFTFEEAWYDVGTPESYLEAVAWHLDGGHLVHDTATLDGVDLGPNVHVMAGAHLEDVAIENAVVFPETTLADTAVEATIVDRDARIEGIELDGAVIGAHTTMVDPSPAGD